MKSIRNKNRELTKLRKIDCLTQMDIFVATGGLIQASKMSHFEQGYISPTDNEIELISKVLQVTKEDIVNTFKK
jgi:hypothetical protein